MPLKRGDIILNEITKIQDSLNMINILLVILSILSILTLGILIGIISGKISLKQVKKLKDLQLKESDIKELHRQDRIKTLGELTASIVHDIGNPLAGMGNLVEILKDEDYGIEVKNEVLDLMSKEIEDLNNLIINYLDFSRESKLDKEYCDIVEVFNDAIKLLKYEMAKKNIKLNIDKQSELPNILIDRRAIKQVIINIIKNSIEAVEEGGFIDIFIDIEDKCMRISVKDNGYGIDRSELENIFNPFYTTKKQGTGLGLSTVYKTIKNHNGDIEVISSLGNGAEFIILLPIVGDDNWSERR
ncbi:MAG: ATP-binding protein [Tissierellaceae bacterium]